MMASKVEKWEVSEMLYAILHLLWLLLKSQIVE